MNLRTKTKLFYEKHKAALITVGVLSSAVVINHKLTIIKTKEGMRLVSADLIEHTASGEKFLYVSHKNGESGRYPWLDAPID